MTEFEIKNYSPLNNKDVLAVSNREVGEKFINQAYLNFFLDNDRAGAKVAITNMGEFAGFCFFQWCLQKELPGCIFTEKKWLNNTFKVGLTGYINLIAVSKKFQNSGIGDALISASLKELKKRSGVIAAVVWKKNGCRDLGVILKKKGFNPALLIKDYWKEDSLKRKYYCAVCGEPPCKCTAEIFIIQYLSQPGI